MIPSFDKLPLGFIPTIALALKVLFHFNCTVLIVCGVAPVLPVLPSLLLSLVSTLSAFCVLCCQGCSL